MRPPLATGEIGDSISLAIVADGFIVEVGPPRKYDPINPSDIGAVLPAPFAPALFATNFIEAPMMQIPEMPLPMTMHQRLYQWPNEGVGPVTTPTVPGVSKPPLELPSGQDVWPAQPITSISPLVKECVQPYPFTDVALDTMAIIPQRGMSLRETWTLYKTMPWIPTVFIRNVQLEGDSKMFIVSGVTYDRLGTTPVGGCEVIVMDSASIGFGLTPIVVAETTSDGSGNYSVQVSSRAVQVFVYLPGAPDRAGVSKNTIIEGTVDIYMRDPTQADTPSGGGAGMSRGRVVNAGS